MQECEKEVWYQCFDPTYKTYFYYNEKKGSHWYHRDAIRVYKNGVEVTDFTPCDHTVAPSTPQRPQPEGQEPSSASSACSQTTPSPPAPATPQPVAKPPPPGTPPVASQPVAKPPPPTLPPPATSQPVAKQTSPDAPPPAASQPVAKPPPPTTPPPDTSQQAAAPPPATPPPAATQPVAKPPPPTGPPPVASQPVAEPTQPVAPPPPAAFQKAAPPSPAAASPPPPAATSQPMAKPPPAGCQPVAPPPPASSSTTAARTAPAPPPPPPVHMKSPAPPPVAARTCPSASSSSAPAYPSQSASSQGNAARPARSASPRLSPGESAEDPEGERGDLSPEDREQFAGVPLHRVATAELKWRLRDEGIEPKESYDRQVLLDMLKEIERMALMTDQQLRDHARNLNLNIWADNLQGTCFERLKQVLYGGSNATSEPPAATKRPPPPGLPVGAAAADVSPRTQEDRRLANEVARIFKVLEFDRSDFAVLDIPENSHPNVAKMAFHKLAKILHPDKCTNEDAVKKAGGRKACDDAYEKVKEAHDRIRNGKAICRTR